MKKGDVVKVSYTGWIKETGELFDTTDKDLAVEKGTYNPNVMYGPACIVVGEGKTIKGVDNELLNLNVGDEKEFEISPENAFGKRSPNLIRLIPQAEFKKNNIDPTPGSRVNIGNLQGKILSSNSGRVRVDFNHPLAGRALLYKIKVEEDLKDDKKRAEGIAQYHLGNMAKIESKDTEIQIETPVEMPEDMKKMITDDINHHAKTIKVTFSVAKKEEKASDEENK